MDFLKFFNPAVIFSQFSERFCAFTGEIYSHSDGQDLLWFMCSHRANKICLVRPFLCGGHFDADTLKGFHNYHKLLSAIRPNTQSTCYSQKKEKKLNTYSLWPPCLRYYSQDQSKSYVLSISNIETLLSLSFSTVNATKVGNKLTYCAFKTLSNVY